MAPDGLPRLPVGSLSEVRVEFRAPATRKSTRFYAIWYGRPPARTAIPVGRDAGEGLPAWRCTNKTCHHPSHGLVRHDPRRAGAGAREPVLPVVVGYRLPGGAGFQQWRQHGDNALLVAHDDSGLSDGPTGIIVHAREDFFFGTQVSGIELLCQRLDDGLVMVAQAVAPIAGRANDSSMPGSPYLRACPTGQVLTGLRGRAGLNVDAVSIVCTEVNANQSTGVVSKGQTFEIGAPIWGPGGSDDAATCTGLLFLRGVDVSFDGVVRRLSVRCGTLAVQSLGNANAAVVRLHPTTRNQRIVFNDQSADTFSLSIVNRGRSITTGEAVVRLTFNRERVAITAPNGCSLQVLSPTVSRFSCGVGALTRGSRRLIAGFQLQPLQILAPMFSVGTVDVVDAAGVQAGGSSAVAVLFPNILWP